MSSSPRTGNYFAQKTSCNAYECDEIGHMFFYSAFRQIYENHGVFILQVYDMNVE